MEEDFNPYAAPKTETLPGTAGACADRLVHLRTESHLRAIGLFFAVGSIVVVLFQFLQAGVTERQFELLEKEFGVIDRGTGEASVPWTAAISIVPFVAGLGLCWLRRWAWILSVAFNGVFAVHNLSALPQSLVGLLFQAMLLRFLLLAKTRRVMLNDYPSIVIATPDLRSPVATWGWWVCGTLTVLAAIASLAI